YDQYYFRPKAAYRILRKAVFNNDERKRLYKEARTFLKLRAQRHKWVKENRKEEAPTPEPAKA
ncbi:MAG: hopanoid biosynthesis associated radical SAM protein HpnJ, partial [Terriglobales bacterium]